jgi:hypothetical protein
MSPERKLRDTPTHCATHHDPHPPRTPHEIVATIVTTNG